MTIVATSRKAPALVAVQTETFVAELLSQHSVLFTEIIDGLPLLLAQPTGDRNQQESERVQGPAHWHRITAKVPATGTATCTI